MDISSTNTNMINSTSSQATSGSNYGVILSPVILLYCVICLLTIITILLLIILLKQYCKKCNANINPESNIEGGTFNLSDLKCDSELDSPNDNVISLSNNLVTYTPCSDDSSSTSSESLQHSCGDKPNDNNQQYLSLKTTLQTADYENVPEGKPASTLDYENKKAEKNRDYVNIQEQQNMPLNTGRKSKSERHKEDQDESQTSSESSSDESDESINYTMVVFKEAPKTT